MNLQLPAQYSKAIATAVGLLITYLQAYGAVWHLVPAVMAIGAVLGVYGVPNAPKPPAKLPAQPPVWTPSPQQMKPPGTV